MSELFNEGLELMQKHERLKLMKINLKHEDNLIKRRLEKIVKLMTSEEFGIFIDETDYLDINDNEEQLGE